MVRLAEWLLTLAPVATQLAGVSSPSPNAPLRPATRPREPPAGLERLLLSLRASDALRPKRLAPCRLHAASARAPSPGQLLPSRAHARGARSRAARPASVIDQPTSRRTDLGEDFQTWHAGCQSGGAFRPIPPARCQNGYVALDIRNTREAVGVARQHLEDGHLKVYCKPTQQREGSYPLPARACRLFLLARKANRYEIAVSQASTW
jgi:hypothetical protein